MHIIAAIAYLVEAFETFKDAKNTIGTRISSDRPTEANRRSGRGLWRVVRCVSPALAPYCLRLTARILLAIFYSTVA